MTDVSIERTDPDRIDRVETLLEASGLPTADVRASPGWFFLADADSEFVGVGGLEIDGSVALLRSIAVLEPRRGRGYGTALCDALEAHARERGVERTYVLTTTAAAFFRGRGYESIARTAVPSPVRETTEFAELCPDSAACLEKRL
jgi:amino-acid N-acetyltransferase